MATELSTAVLQGICTVLCDSRQGMTDAELVASLAAADIADVSPDDRIARRMLLALTAVAAMPDGERRIARFVAHAVEMLERRQGPQSDATRLLLRHLGNVLRGTALQIRGSGQ